MAAAHAAEQFGEEVAEVARFPWPGWKPAPNWS
jgi:hypothetical protein